MEGLRRPHNCILWERSQQKHTLYRQERSLSTKALSLRAAYEFGEAHGLQAEVAEIRDLVIEWDRPISSSLRRGFIVELFEKRGVFAQFCAEHWPFSATEKGASKLRYYQRLRSEYREFLDGSGPEEEDPDSEVEDGAAGRFALESHLRDYLAANMGRIEPGLTLFSGSGKSGVEFPVDGGRVDLLGVDANGRFVVVELKLSRGRNKALGQLLYYMGWVDANLGKAPCRGYIIASEITEELRVAVKRAQGVSLAQYNLSFSVTAVAS
jgi:hypothetical protein